MQDTSLKYLARAKINLFLHVVGKRSDGYHSLESIMGFTDICDEISVTPAPTISLNIKGNSSLSLDENLILKAAHLLKNTYGITDGAAFTLTKFIPVGAGLGGGSADAAAALHLLKNLWNIDANNDAWQKHALSLGADVPVCFSTQTSVVRGIGEQLAPIEIPSLPMVLVNPNKSLSTREVFSYFSKPFSKPVDIPKSMTSVLDVTEFLKTTHNDLESVSIKRMPEIATILSEISKQKDCLLSRMSGSGATCYGVFLNTEAAALAARTIQKKAPHWWVRSTALQG